MTRPLFRLAFFLCLTFFPANAAPAGKIDVRTPLRKSDIKLPVADKTPWRAPDVRRVVSDSGVEAWLIEEKSTPVIAVSVLFDGGKASDPKHLTGLSTLATSLLDEGAGKYDAARFYEILRENGINMTFSASAETIRATMTALRDTKETAFDLFGQALSRPRFDAKAVRRMKSRMQAAVSARKGDPSAVAAERWAKLIYKDHPFSDMFPTSRSIKRIAKANLRRWKRERLARDNMLVGVAGNISAEELKPLLDKAFAELPEKSRVRPVPPFTPDLTAGIDVLSMNVPQSAVIFGHAGITRNDPDFYAAALLNYIFGGGGFASRLFNEVREKKGLAYSVYTGLNVDQAAPMLTGAVDSDNAKLPEAINIIREEWAKIARDGVTVRELNDAKTYLTGAFPLSFSSSERLASFLTAMRRYGLGIDYLNRHNALIDAVTPEQAKEMAKRLFKPGSLFFVVVGKPANL